MSDNKLQALHAAISDVDGKTKFYITNSPLSGGLFKHDVSRKVNQTRKAIEWEEVIVNCFSLDTLFKDIYHLSPDLVKVDVEGSELRVLRGCRRILQEGKTRFLIEIHGWTDPDGQKNATEVFNFMKSFGYYPTSLYGRHLFTKTAPLQILILRYTTQVKRLLGMARRMLPVFGHVPRWQLYTH